jgi:hypothetical protein
MWVRTGLSQGVSLRPIVRTLNLVGDYRALCTTATHVLALILVMRWVVITSLSARLLCGASARKDWAEQVIRGAIGRAYSGSCCWLASRGTFIMTAPSSGSSDVFDKTRMWTAGRTGGKQRAQYRNPSAYQTTSN